MSGAEAAEDKGIVMLPREISRLMPSLSSGHIPKKKGLLKRTPRTARIKKSPPQENIAALAASVDQDVGSEDKKRRRSKDSKYGSIHQDIKMTPLWSALKSASGRLVPAESAQKKSARKMKAPKTEMVKSDNQFFSKKTLKNAFSLRKPGFSAAPPISATGTREEEQESKTPTKRASKEKITCSIKRSGSPQLPHKPTGIRASSSSKGRLKVPAVNRLFWPGDFEAQQASQQNCVLSSRSR